MEVSTAANELVVSPTTLMATLNTVRAVLKEPKAGIRPGVIQKEVGTLVEDIGRLDSRIESLSKHFKQANEDVDNIRISSSKIGKRIQRIEDIELGEAANHLAVAHLANDE